MVVKSGAVAPTLSAAPAGAAASVEATMAMRSLRIGDLLADSMNPYGGSLTAAWLKVRAGLLGRRSCPRREQPRHDVEKQHHRPGDQSQSDKADANDCRVDAGVIS